MATSIAANVNLWPRPISVVANAKAIERLTDEQRDALEGAAHESLDDSVRQLEANEQEAVGILCRRGRVRFDRADETALGQLHAAAEPVISELSKDTETAAVLADIAALRIKALSVADNETVPRGRATEVHHRYGRLRPGTPLGAADYDMSVLVACRSCNRRVKLPPDPPPNPRGTAW